MKVITHQTPNGDVKVQLCPAHSADLSIVKKHLGANYGGVYMGLHDGFCLECEHVRGDSADADDAAVKAWLDAALPPEDRRPLTAREVAETDEALVGAGGDRELLTLAGGERAISEYTQRWADE